MLLPTDTQALRPITKQHELFGRRLGQGIPRRNGAVGVVVVAVWVLLMWVLGVPFWTEFGPALFIGPPFALVHFSTRSDKSGRQAYIRWYDTIAARMPGRHEIIANPATPAVALKARGPERIYVVAELIQQPPTAPLPTTAGARRLTLRKRNN